MMTSGGQKGRHCLAPGNALGTGAKRNGARMAAIILSSEMNPHASQGRVSRPVGAPNDFRGRIPGPLGRADEWPRRWRWVQTPRHYRTPAEAGASSNFSLLSG